MKAFLRQIAELFWQQKGAAVSRLAFVFPNRRAGLFFQKYLSEEADRPLFSPKILTISDLFTQLSGLRPIDHISLLFRLYDIYIRQSKREETFDQFLYWGEMLLNDFDDVDKYMVDAKALFSNIGDLKQIEETFGYLDPQLVETLKSFWHSFCLKEKDVNQREFLSMWQLLYDIYSELRKGLLAEGKGYEGMIFREVVERLEAEEQLELPYEQVVFVGLNAMSRSEEMLLDLLRDGKRADFYWDYDSPCVTDVDNKASFFALRNVNRYPSLYPLPKELRSEATKVEVIAIPGSIGQAKQLSNLLEQICGEGTLDDETALRTAVVLPDERMLIPVLNSIPEKIRHINVTMGYPLKDTPISVLIDLIISLQKNISWEQGKCCFYYRDVMSVVNHRYVALSSTEMANKLMNAILKGNIVHVPEEMLKDTPIFSCIFHFVEHASDFSNYLIEIIEALNAQLPEARDDEELSAAEQLHRNAEKGFLFKYYTVVNRMKEVMTQVHVDITLDTYYRMLKKMIDGVTIPFVGEPLSGLQIMGVLETRALDFDRVIILSMNEGIFPLKKAAGSYIPYNLRKGFGLPTYEHQDSVWAYHFYRLIYRANEVHLLYDTRSEGLQTGEVSRYVAQMQYLYHVDVKRRTVVYQIKAAGTPPVTILKTPEVMQRMSRYYRITDNDSLKPQFISASNINQYLNCPLQFYFANVEGIQDHDTVQEMILEDVFGSLFHKVMELLYKPFKGKRVTKEDINRIRKDKTMLADVLRQAFADKYFMDDKTHEMVGYNYLISELIDEYVQKTLDCDAQFAPFDYVDAELQMRDFIKLGDGREIHLKGFIDRVDKVNGRLRIIDYKSGKAELKSKSVEALFDSSNDKRAHQVLQVFFYSWLYRRDKGKGQQIQPGIYSLRSLYGDSFSPQTTIGSDQVDDFTPYEEAFGSFLKHTVEEIFDSSVPFKQTDNVGICSNCMFANICGKG